MGAFESRCARAHCRPGGSGSHARLAGVPTGHVQGAAMGSRPGLGVVSSAEGEGLGGVGAPILIRVVWRGWGDGCRGHCDDGVHRCRGFDGVVVAARVGMRRRWMRIGRCCAVAWVAVARRWARRATASSWSFRPRPRRSRRWCRRSGTWRQHDWPAGEQVRVRMGVHTGTRWCMTAVMWGWMCTGRRGSPRRRMVGRWWCRRRRPGWSSGLGLTDVQLVDLGSHQLKDLAAAGAAVPAGR